MGARVRPGIVAGAAGGSLAAALMCAVFLGWTNVIFDEWSDATVKPAPGRQARIARVEPAPDRSPPPVPAVAAPRRRTTSPAPASPRRKLPARRPRAPQAPPLATPPGAPTPAPASAPSAPVPTPEPTPTPTPTPTATPEPTLLRGTVAAVGGTVRSAGADLGARATQVNEPAGQTVVELTDRIADTVEDVAQLMP